MRKALQKQFNRKQWVADLARDFAHENKGLFIIIADPETDLMVAGYKDKFIMGAIKDAQGKHVNVVRDALKYSTKMQTTIDAFMIQLAEFLWLKVKDANEFFKFVNDAIFHLRTSLSKRAQSAILKSQKVEPTHHSNNAPSKES